jgi:hypothetical protein
MQSQKLEVESGGEAVNPKEVADRYGRGGFLRLLACSLRQVLPLSRYRNILINSYFGSTRIKVREAQQKDFVLSSSVSLVDSDNSFICKCRCTGEQFPSLKYLSRSNT